MIDYGAKGCRCFRDEVDVSLGEDGGVTRALGRWLPNAACPHHGLLADFTERKDTGVYTVVPLSGHKMDRPVIEQPTGCRCSVNDPHPCAYCWKVQAELDMQRIAASGEDLSGEPDAWTPETTEQERQRGLRATVRRAWNRVGRLVYGDAWPYWF
jgi:hypothetical protein